MLVSPVEAGTMRPCILLSSLLPLLGVGASSVNVQTRIGTIAGVPNASLSIDAFLGVPFAQPPVGSLRFKAPLPLPNSPSAMRNASSFGPACPQRPSDSLGSPQSEDCLFLNVRILMASPASILRRDVRSIDQQELPRLRSFPCSCGFM